MYKVPPRKGQKSPPAGRRVPTIVGTSNLVGTTAQPPPAGVQHLDPVRPAQTRSIQGAGPQHVVPVLPATSVRPPSASMTSTTCSSAPNASEVRAAEIVACYLCSCQINPVMYLPNSGHPGRNIPLSEEIRQLVQKLYRQAQSAASNPHPFWSFYAQGKGSGQGETKMALLLSYIQCDYFAYAENIDAAKTADPAPADMPPNKILPSDDFIEAICTPLRDVESPEADVRQACLFEVTESGQVQFKLAQLELRLAVFTAKRFLKLYKTVDDCDWKKMLENHVAAAGVVVPQSMERVVRQIVGAKDAAGVLPLVSLLVHAEKFHVLHFGMPSTLKPKVSVRQCDGAVWVQLRDSLGALIGQPFKVTPAGSDVDALKKAIKAELGADCTCSAPRITILAPGTTVHAEADLALSETSAKNPYLFLLP